MRYLGTQSCPKPFACVQNPLSQNGYIKCMQTVFSIDKEYLLKYNIAI